MYYYRVYEHIVASTVPFELSPCSRGKPDFFYKVINEKYPVEQQSITWRFDFYYHGEIWSRLGEISPGKYVCCIFSYADFLIDLNTSRITCYPCEAGHTRKVQQLFLNHILPQLLSNDGYLVLHANAVARGIDAIGFLATTWGGKSTLATHFGQQRGWGTINDDCLVLKNTGKQFRTLKGYPGIRLRKDMAERFTNANEHLTKELDYGNAILVTPEQGSFSFHEGKAYLRALFQLAEPDEETVDSAIDIKRFSMTEAFGLLVDTLYRHDPDKQLMKREFESLTALLSSVPVYRLTYPRDLQVLPDVRDAILNKIS